MRRIFKRRESVLLFLNVEDYHSHNNSTLAKHILSSSFSFNIQLRPSFPCFPRVPCCHLPNRFICIHYPSRALPLVVSFYHREFASVKISTINFCLSSVHCRDRV